MVKFDFSIMECFVVGEREERNGELGFFEKKKNRSFATAPLFEAHHCLGVPLLNRSRVEPRISRRTTKRAKEKDSRMSARSLKVEHSGDIRRLDLSLFKSYAKFVKLVREIFNISELSGIQMSYEDEEGDRINIRSEMDMIEARRYASLVPSFKLHVQQTAEQPLEQPLSLGVYPPIAPEDLGTKQKRRRGHFWSLFFALLPSLLSFTPSHTPFPSLHIAIFAILLLSPRQPAL